MLERQARDLEVRGSNLGPGSNFSLESKFKMKYLDEFYRRKAGKMTGHFLLYTQSDISVF